MGVREKLEKERSGRNEGEDRSRRNGEKGIIARKREEREKWEK